MESKVQGLAKLLREHRRCRLLDYTKGYECVCGEPVSSNSHHVMSQHQADKVLEHLGRIAERDKVSTLEELSALPNGSVIVDKFGDAGLIEHDHVKFAETAKLHMAYVAKHYLPATVIYRPVK